MINIDASIEKISNGFVVTCIKGGNYKRYYPSIEDFVKVEIMEEIKVQDREFLEREQVGTSVSFSLKSLREPSTNRVDATDGT